MEREYNKDKYGACLEYLSTHPHATPEDLKWFELGQDKTKEICVACVESLFRTTHKEAWQYYTDEFLRHILPYAQSADIIYDLGCGYGYHLDLLKQHLPHKKFFGGEFASNALTIAKKIFANSRVTFEQIDLTNPEFIFPFGKNDSVLIFTGYVFDNLPSVKDAIERIVSIKGKQWNIGLIEPIFEWCSDSLLGLLRKKYTLENDYNRDLLTILESHPNIEIIQKDKEFFGMNPLHPASFVCWR